MERSSKDFSEFSLEEKVAMETLNPEMKILTFHEWKEAHNLSFLGSDFRLFALEKMAKRAITFRNWNDVYLVSEFEPKIRQLALDNMVRLAKTLHDWNTIYPYSQIGSETQMLALKKRAELKNKKPLSFEEEVKKSIKELRETIPSTLVQTNNN